MRLNEFIKRYSKIPYKDTFYVVRRKPYRGKKWWEPKMHCFKTLDGIIHYLQKDRLVKSGGYTVYEFQFSKAKIIVDEGSYYDPTRTEEGNVD